MLNSTIKDSYYLIFKIDSSSKLVYLLDKVYNPLKQKKEALEKKLL